MKYLITGGTGLIGRNLSKSLLADGHEVHNVGRGLAKKKEKGFHHHQWDGRVVPDSVPKVDVVVNLAGANIGQRWTPEYKKLLISSRVNATKACVDYINKVGGEGVSFLSASGYNYYGDLLETPVDETAVPADPDSFMSQICQQWEEAAKGTSARTVIMRISVVLDPNDGPLAKMLTPYKFFVGGPTGTGKQGFPCIHIDDIVAAIRFLAEQSSTSGPVNMVSPESITQDEFSDALASQLRRPNFFRLPKGILNLIFGEMSVVLWGGAFVIPKVLMDEGFEYKYPSIKSALKHLLS